MAALGAICAISHAKFSTFYQPDKRLSRQKTFTVVARSDDKAEREDLCVKAVHLFTTLLFLCLCRVEEAYRRIIGPACVTVDASPSADQVLQQVQLLIKAKCHL